MPPPSWQERALREEAARPPDCGGLCHRPLGFQEDEPFLHAAARYSLALKNFHKRERHIEDVELKQRAEGGLSLLPERVQIEKERASAASSYVAALSVYLQALRQRGIGAARIKYIEKKHNLWNDIIID